QLSPGLTANEQAYGKPWDGRSHHRKVSGGWERTSIVLDTLGFRVHGTALADDGIGKIEGGDQWEAWPPVQGHAQRSEAAVQAEVGAPSARALRWGAGLQVPVVCQRVGDNWVGGGRVLEKRVLVHDVARTRIACSLWRQ